MREEEERDRLTEMRRADTERFEREEVDRIKAERRSEAEEAARMEAGRRDVAEAVQVSAERRAAA